MAITARNAVGVEHNLSLEVPEVGSRQAVVLAPTLLLARFLPFMVASQTAVAIGVQQILYVSDLEHDHSKVVAFYVRV
ncbi:hypothetical protein HBI56_145570 [Parastagonospora nodorum]|nr:hypothetical protein HBH53_042090 [Parastagonospora nodorum]KAH3979912.1 hypothetical protein HBH51_053120 [Parastagonospora nodorum]KAH4341288.1 hypothetical protein HBH98_176370 [Parastagonospora nodorum]KAH4369345.1 hypothetical protein HBH97_147510 [Parastagonospora nodorum]KAH4386950.1 hypothetical protein HBH99_168340 [Parastagonospora nodorum]